MDSAHKSNRKYPSYTTAELEAVVAAGNGNEVMVEEISRRHAGLSKPFATPQLLGGKPVVKVGRM